MSVVRVQQVSGSTFTAEGKTDTKIIMGSGKNIGEGKVATSPMELVLYGLGGCTALDVESILKKMKLTVDNIEIIINSTRSETHPKVFTQIDMVYHFYGEDLPLKKLERAVKLSKESYCSVSAMLAKTADITAQIETHNSI